MGRVARWNLFLLSGCGHITGTEDCRGSIPPCSPPWRLSLLGVFHIRAVWCDRPGHVQLAEARSFAYQLFPDTRITLKFGLLSSP